MLEIIIIELAAKCKLGRKFRLKADRNAFFLVTITHVLVNDPTMGYGIFIENMLEAAG